MPTLRIELSNKRFKAAQVPKGFELHALDYDIDKYDADVLEEGPDGKQCRYTIYGPPEKNEPIYASLKNNKLKVRCSTKMDITVRTYDKHGAFTDAPYEE